jgi:hypothetical protein
VGCKDFSWWSEEEEEAEGDEEVCCLVKWVIHRSMWEEPFVHLQVPHHPERERERERERESQSVSGCEYSSSVPAWMHSGSSSSPSS